MSISSPSDTYVRNVRFSPYVILELVNGSMVVAACSWPCAPFSFLVLINACISREIEDLVETQLRILYILQSRVVLFNSGLRPVHQVGLVILLLQPSASVL